MFFLLSVAAHWPSGSTTLRSWSFLTNHALVLVYVGRHPESTGLEIAQAAGITERATRAILSDLEKSGCIQRERIGRRNRYHIDVDRPVTRIEQRDLTVGQILEILEREDATMGTSSRS